MLGQVAACCLFAILCAVPRPGRAATEKQPAVAVPSTAEITSKLRREHPRLLASAKDFAQLKQRIVAEPQLKDWHAELCKHGERMLKDAPSKYEIPDGLRLLSTSRRVLDRVYTLAMLYRLDGDRRYPERAWRELEAAANFKDWNPRHFLDTAEMTHAFAIGYDWLYDFWTPQQRQTLRNSMLEKGIKLANDIHNKNTWWARAHHNWNQVCNGGIGMGALALLDEAPEPCGRFLQAAIRSIQLPMAEFAPDGAWAEGPGYWAYATQYNVAFLAGLESALGTDFGLSRMEGFSQAGSFPLYASGPTGQSFNYADVGAGTIRGSQMLWFARKFNNADYARYGQRTARPHALDLLWFDRKLTGTSTARLPLDKYFRNSEIAMFRSAWDDRDAVFVGFKSGDNKANHSNLDLGSFVLDALGERWAEDLGSDNYNLPGYFGKQRWDYYRLRAEGHNTLVINPGAAPDQDPRAVARIVRFESKPDKAFALTDLTPAYAKTASSVVRGIALLDRKRVLVQDEIQAKLPAEVWWFLHTSAKINADGATAVLQRGDARVWVRILTPADARFQVMEAQPLPSSPHPEKQGNNKRVRKLAIQLNRVSHARLAVLLVPLPKGEAPPKELPAVSGLKSW